MQIRDILARNIKRVRLERGLSQEELAHHADIDRTYVNALERRVYAASIDVVGRIAKGLNVEPAALLAKPVKTPRAVTRKRCCPPPTLTRKHAKKEMPLFGRNSFRMLGHKIKDQMRNLVGLLVEREMARVEQVNFGLR